MDTYYTTAGLLLTEPGLMERISHLGDTSGCSSHSSCARQGLRDSSLRFAPAPTACLSSSPTRYPGHWLDTLGIGKLHLAHEGVRAGCTPTSTRDAQLHTEIDERRQGVLSKEWWR
ncbi:hypothetical protein [Streptomyces sp. NPDC058773]|uniref:hypothetical protein n=1 Tax=Streptomyces sp. NPDC058773 TaxID=3346632 RepID=UPI0036AD62A4